MKKETNGSPIILVLYVDDMLIAGKHVTSLQELKCKLKYAFSMKDLRNAECILGIRIRPDKQKKLLCMSQEKYIEKVLGRLQMTDAKLSKVHYPKDKEDMLQLVGH